MKKNEKHVEMRNIVNNYVDKGVSVDEISRILNVPIGTRYVRGSVKWYIFCYQAQKNQRVAITKHPGLYSRAGRIAQQKHPHIGYFLGKKFGPIQGKINAKKLKGNSEYFSKMAKKLQETNPNHSRNNMKKAHNTMKKQGTFHDHQRKAALQCRKKHPHQLKEMSRKAHGNHPLALLALESRRQNLPYKFMGCRFDSNSERELCKLFVKHGLLNQPEEGKNIHFRLNRCHIDFFLKKIVFVEYHPPMQYGRKKGETYKSYLAERRYLLDKYGYKDFPLFLITSLNGVEEIINSIKDLLAFELK
ncbi:MAG: hypothetical protein KKG59_00455 [Nanoarchaeota archaeon]|nr:hypothetical protein [Nanoarchaeota archaeon]